MATQLKQISDMFVPAALDQVTNYGLKMTDYQRQLVTNAMQQIYELGKENDFNQQDWNFNQNNINSILLSVISLQLNANADPAEMYLSVRKKYQDRKMIGRSIEMGIQGDGNDMLLSKYGRNVKTVYPYWVVREKDVFKPAKHVGIEVVPPEWQENDAEERGKVVRIVYPVAFWTESREQAKANNEQRTFRVDYYSASREDVKPNLLAHMLQNTYAYEYSERQTKRNEIKDKASTMSVDEILDSSEMIKLGKISPAWHEPYSRESMITRKMRNNIVRKIPKDFSSALQALKYQNAMIEDEEDHEPLDVTPDKPDMAGANSEEFIETGKAKSENIKPKEAEKEPVTIDESDPDGSTTNKSVNSEQQDIFNTSKPW